MATAAANERNCFRRVENVGRDEVPKALCYTYAEPGPNAGAICVHLRVLRLLSSSLRGRLRFLGPRSDAQERYPAYHSTAKK